MTTDHNVTLTVQTNADVTNLTLADFDIVVRSSTVML